MLGAWRDPPELRDADAPNDSPSKKADREITPIITKLTLDKTNRFVILNPFCDATTPSAPSQITNLKQSRH